MPYTPERIAKIHQKEAATPDALKRDPAVDYYHGWFFVTLNTREGVPVLSWCEGDPALFVHGYNDTEPITESEIEIKRAYIRDQARKRLIQGDHHTCFVKRRHQHTKSWTVSVCMQAVVNDRCFRDYERLEAAMLHVLSRLNSDVVTNSVSAPAAAPISACVVTLPSGRQVQMPGIGLDYTGNPSLLYSTQKLPLVCHSADTSRFEEQKAAVLDAARRGSIIVSAFISPKERNIKQQLMVEQLPFIEILDNGIPEKYKEDIKVTRELCLVMNELARVVSGQRDDWWKPAPDGNL